MSTISSLAAVAGIKGVSEPVTAALSGMDPSSGAERGNSLIAFQYFPETITDSKGAEYSKRRVPGGSHPIMSFTDGGERVISFPAVFTQEMTPEPKNLGTLLTGGFSLSLSDALGNKNKSKQDKSTVNIAAAIAWLRQYTYPRYVKNVSKAPDKVILYLPNSGIVGADGYIDSLVAVMTQCDVTYEVFHRNGAPRLVVVQLSFSEVVQTGPKWKFMGADVLSNAAIGYQRNVNGAAGQDERKKVGSTQEKKSFTSLF